MEEVIKPREYLAESKLCINKHALCVTYLFLFAWYHEETLEWTED
jgi:hypothetical protein